MEEAHILLPLLADGHDVISVPDWDWRDPLPHGRQRRDPECLESEDGHDDGSTKKSPWNESDSGWSSFSSPSHIYPQIVGLDNIPDFDIFDLTDIDNDEKFDGTHEKSNDATLCDHERYCAVSESEKQHCPGELILEDPDNNVNIQSTDLYYENFFNSDDNAVSNLFPEPNVATEKLELDKSTTEKTVEYDSGNGRMSNATKGQLFTTVNHRHSYALSPSKESIQTTNLTVNNKSTFIDTVQFDNSPVNSSRFTEGRSSKRKRTGHITNKNNDEEVDMMDFILDKNRKNAEMAKLNREKKKAYINSLESELKKLKSDKHSLKLTSVTLSNEVKSLKSEVNYLRSVLSNDSCLASLINKIPITTPVLTKKFKPTLECNENKNSTGGICLHVSNDKISLEFCAKCSYDAATHNTH